ncbi:MAG TPA: hypothetical protein VHB22_04230 [Hyphomicrobium sp.]|jgi:hypothetical protein|nr:hypothetical protein [Hyphomicrobium sp.]
MLNSPLHSSDDSDASPEDLERIVSVGPQGAIALAGVSTFIVIALWFAFYVFVFLPRGVTG